MSINLDDYADFLEQGDQHVRDAFNECFAEAARVMSPVGLQNYLEGARGLNSLGRGSDLVISYLYSMPAVVKETGEAIIADCVTSAMKLSSMVSGEVIGLLFDSLPTAARRLGDVELVRGYLSLIHQLSAKAPRGLRPMLAHLDELFSKLTLGGLRRWALWGAQAHAKDFKQQVEYFNLASNDSKSVIQKERRGTLFIDNQRRLNFYLRALWARDFFMRPTSGDYESRQGYRPYIEKRVIHLPDAYDDFCGITGKELYRAASAHAAAHLMHMPRPISAEALSPAQMYFIGLFEDARIEHLAIRDFPGLRRLWLPFHEKLAEGTPPSDPVVNILQQTAHALLAESPTSDDPDIIATVNEFSKRFSETPHDNQISWDLGISFFNRLGARTAIPSQRVLESLEIPYYDDNRYLWAFDEQEWYEAEYIPASHRQTRKTVNVMEMVNEVDCELAGDDAQEIWHLETEFFRDGDPPGTSMNQLEGKESVSQPYHYQEWDYQVQLHRPDWATVLEKKQSKGNPEQITQILTDYKPLASRIKHIIDALQPEGVIRQRRQEDGEEIDLNAAIRAMVDIRTGEMPDPRINIRYIRKTRDFAILILLDLSESTNETLPGSDRPVLQLAQEATALVSWAIDNIGDPFAVHGFSSDGRHDVQYFRFKDFDQSYDDIAKARLAGMKGGLSTRMGAALRHAGNFLLHQQQQKKLILLISDGEPADIDVRDPQYLRHDTKKAVEELSAKGVKTYCLTLDPDADNYVSRIFGNNGYTIVDHVQKLPEKLPALFATLTR